MTAARKDTAIQSQLLKIPPHDLDAEKAVLGSIFINTELIYDVISIIGYEPEVFYDAKNRIIYDAFLELLETTKSVDMITLKSVLDRRHETENIGGMDYLTSLVETVEVAAHAQEYAQIVKDKYVLRSLINAGTDIINMCFSSSDPAKEVLDKAAQKIMKVAETQFAMKDFRTLGELGTDFIKAIGDPKSTGIQKFGYRELDEKTFGLHPGELIIIAARPSIGKTTLGVNICINIASELLKKKKSKEEKPDAVCIFSLEMSAGEIFRRMLACEGHIPMNNLRYEALDKVVTGRMQDKINAIVDKMTGYPIYVDASASSSVLEMKTRARKIQIERGLALIMIDYIQLMSGSPQSGRQGRQFEIAEISRNLKMMAKDLRVPVIVLSQLSREVTKRTGKAAEPRLSDLRDSGAIEQDADLVLFLHEPYDTEENFESPIIKVIIGKQRNGSLGKLDLKFMKKYSQFVDVEKTFGDETPI
ncbi:MAG: replicative DNA helicase [Elusimicrobia bacterium CG08_land_8_20_14_0_20_44_26]|nr:MAG: replicative DNA helicase [Elusimicrobia bacterium CG08_land_8_20_14_0_20_44_26]